MTWDRYVNVHHLDNLVWVWNVNTPGGSAGSIADYYPGPQYVDILTIDIYGSFNPDYYASMLALADGKPIALGEVGAAPTPEILAAQPRWAYFMVWSNLVDFSNKPDALTVLYHSPQALTRDDPAIAQPMAAMRAETAERTGGKASGAPATPGATEAARAFLARLYVVSGSSTLSGQQNTAEAVGVATTAVTAATGDAPAIDGEELGIDSDARVDPVAAHRAMMERAGSDQKQGIILALTWHAAPPTDDTRASDLKSVGGRLTDFEWAELLTPGTDLNKHWCAQVDNAAETLRALQDAGTAVL
jgi:hypothetical protein